MICACKRDDGKCGDARIVDGRIVCGVIPVEFRSKVCACGAAGRCLDAKISDDRLLCGRLADALAVAKACGWRPANKSHRKAPLTVAARDAAVGRVAEGESQGAIAVELGVDRATVARWCERAGVKSRFRFAGGREDLKIRAEIAREREAAAALAATNTADNPLASAEADVRDLDAIR